MPSIELIAAKEEQNGEWIKSTCAYCGVGCGIEARVSHDGSVEVRGDNEHPANYGRLCSKGMALGETIVPDGRLLSPSVHGENTDWDTALSRVANELKSVIKKHGPDSVAFYVSGQILTEDYYVANKLMKGFIGSGNIDTNSRLCMSSSVAGHKRAFGSDTVPGCYSDIEQADMVVITGSNLAWCHPVIYQRLKAAKAQRPEMRIVVVDPRATDTCEIADLHLPLQPGTDVALFNGLLSKLAQSQKVDERYVRDHTEGYNHALMAALEDGSDLLELATVTGVSENKLNTFFEWFLQTEKVVTLYSQGVNQSTSGADKVNSIINCHLATGRIGKPGAGPFSITGQPNAMGGREVGGLANTLASHMEFDNPEHRKIVSKFWNTRKLAKNPGLKAVELFDAVAEGKVKAVWIMATNPVVSLPNADKVKRALEECELVIVSDCIADTDTTRVADILLPAQGWSEKSGTVTNSERRISRQRALVKPMGEAKPDWWIISQVAQRMGYKNAFDYQSEKDIFTEYAAMTGIENNGSRDLDISGLKQLSNSDYDDMQPVQWPCVKGDEPTENKRMFSDGQFFTANGKAHFVAVRYRGVSSPTSKEYPLTLNSGRIRDQWHTMSRSGLSAKLSAHLPEPFVTINPEDAKANEIEDGNLVNLISAKGAATVRAQISDQMVPGQTFMPIHWTGVTASQARVCAMISPEVDNLSGQPEFKATPIALKPWKFDSEALLLSRFQIDTSDLDYWVRQKVTGGYLYRVASLQPSESLEKKLKSLCNNYIPAKELQFASNTKGEYRFASINADNALNACFVISTGLKSADFEWLQSLLTEPLTRAAENSILTGVAEGSLATGKIVCACKQVGYKTLCNSINKHQISDVETLGQLTTAGTGCGTCIPELQKIIDDQKPKPAKSA